MSTKLITNRLILEEINDSHVADIYSLIYHDKDVLKYFVCPYSSSLEEARPMIQKTIKFYKDNAKYCFAIKEKDTNNVVGWILQCDRNSQNDETEIGYALGKKYWGKGYATEAFKEMIKFMFSLGHKKVICCHIKENIASKRVIEKCGLVFDKEIKGDLIYLNKSRDVYYYHIDKKDI